MQEDELCFFGLDLDSWEGFLMAMVLVNGEGLGPSKKSKIRHTSITKYILQSPNHIMLWYPRRCWCSNNIPFASTCYAKCWWWRNLGPNQKILKSNMLKHYTQTCRFHEPNFQGASILAFDVITWGCFVWSSPWNNEGCREGAGTWLQDWNFETLKWMDFLNFLVRSSDSMGSNWLVQAYVWRNLETMGPTRTTWLVICCEKLVRLCLGWDMLCSCLA